MTSSKDQFGTITNIGDYVVFTYSYQNGNTRLTKGKILSFTKAGNPRVGVKRYIWNSETQQGEYGLGVKVIVGSWARAYDSLGSEEEKL